MSTPEERKKQLAKLLSDWKAQFKQDNGRNPTQQDIEADEAVNSMFTEYNTLKKELVAPTTTTATTNNDEAAAAAAAGSERPFDPEELKKYLVKQLNEWKANFKTSHDGHGPGQSDIDADPTIKAIFDEFSLLKKGAHPSQQREQDVHHQPANAEEAASTVAAAAAAPAHEDHQTPSRRDSTSTRPSEPEELKKFLAKQLNEWKTNFKTSHDGHGPGQSDIDADPVVRAIFDEFSALKKGTHPSQQQGQQSQQQHEELQENTSLSPPPLSQPSQPSQLPAPAADESQHHQPEEKEVPQQQGQEQPQQQHVLSSTMPSIAIDPSERPTDPEELKKFFAKHLNDWKSHFKAAHAEGKGPGQSDIDADPAVKAVFDEFSQLKTGTHPLQQHPNEPQEEAPTAAAVTVQEREPEPEREAKLPAVVETPAASRPALDLEPRPATADPDELKKYFAKQLNDWKTHFKAAHPDGKGPGQSDIDADATIKSMFDEFSQLKKGTHRLQQQQQQEQPPPEQEKPQQELPQQQQLQLQQQQQHDHDARKKELAKLLSDWKTDFKESHGGKGPGQSDIDADPSVKALYDEYTLLKKGGSTEASPSKSEQSRDDESKSAVAATAVVVPVREEAPQAPPTPPPVVEYSPSSSNPEEHKKQLAKILAEWKANFKAQHSRGPKQQDIDADEYISKIYGEYTTLKKGSDENKQQQEQPPVSATQQQQQEQEHEQQQQQQQQQEQVNDSFLSPDDMKKHLAKRLADWKSNFKATHGSNPKQHDIEQDAETNIVFQQYNLLKAGGSIDEAILIRTNASNERLLKQQQQQVAASSNRTDEPFSSSTTTAANEERKKHLAKILADWKANFRSIHNKNPAQSDVMGDPEIKEVYEEYSCLKSGKPYIAPSFSASTSPGAGAAASSFSPAESRGPLNNNQGLLHRRASFREAMDDAGKHIYGEDDDQQQIDEDNASSYLQMSGAYQYSGQINLNNISRPENVVDRDKGFHGDTGEGKLPEQQRLLRSASSAGFDGTTSLQGTGNGTEGGSGAGGGGGGKGFLSWLGGGDDEGGDKDQVVDAVTHEHNLKMWDHASARARIFTLLEPSSSLIQPHARFQRATTVYHAIYLVMLFSYIAVALAETVEDSGVNNAIRVAFIGIPNMWFTFDFILRATTVNEWQYVPMILIDLLSLTTCWYHLSDRRLFDGGQEVVRIFPHLRVLRLLLFTRLFVRKEFFRDIEITLLTVESSLKPLFLFAVLLFIFVLLFSTFIFLTERGDWNEALKVWERPCRQFVSAATCVGFERSPFQSIPDGLWLTVQLMTTTGFGDTLPTSLWGRVVAGIAMIVGVFAISFPTMLFIGNLEQVRKDYFAQLEKERVERSYRLDMIKILQEQQAAVERAHMAQAEMTMDLGATMNAAMNATMNATMNFATLGLKVNRDSNMVLFDETVDDEIPAQPLEGPTVAYFSFMGNAARQIKKTRRGEFIYEPIMEFLCDPDDGAPVLSSVVEIDTGVFMAQLTLIIDDLVAQELACEAVLAHLSGDNAPENGAAPKALGVYALEVTLSAPAGSGSSNNTISVVRRIDASKILENSVPVTIEINAEQVRGVYDVQSAKEYARALLAQANAVFHVSYCRAPVSSAIWQKSVPVTSIMLSTTPFIHDLLEISRYASVADLLDSSDKRRKANDAAKRRRNVAFVAHRDVPELVYPVFRKIVGGSRYVIRNAAQFVEALTEMVILHCRRVRHHEIPEDLRSCVYNRRTVSLSEELMEVDLDYFRTVDWPLGTVVVEFAEMRGRVSCAVPIMSGCNREQPIVADASAYERTAILQKEALHRLCTTKNNYNNSNNTIDFSQRGDVDFDSPFGGHGGGGGGGKNESDVGLDRDENFDGVLLRDQKQYGSMHGAPVKSKLAAQEAPKERNLSSLLAPSEFH